MYNILYGADDGRREFSSAQEAKDMFFGHMAEVLGLLVLGLLIFGPKRMIEMGGQLGKVWRETRDAMKEMNWNPLSDEKQSSGFSQTPLGKFSQLAQDFTAPRVVDAQPAEPAHVVETPPTQSQGADIPAE